MGPRAAPDGDRLLRVLHLIDHSLPKYSGYSFRSRYIVRILRKLGCEPSVMTSARHDVFEELEESIDGITHYRTRVPDGALDRVQLRIPFWRERIMTAAMVKRLHEVIAVEKPEIIHAHSPFFNGQAALRAAAKHGIPVVYEIRAFWEDDAVDKNKIREDDFVYRQVRRLETQVVRRADGVICICEGLQRDLVARGIPAEKIAVTRNGVELEAFEPRPGNVALARKYGVEGKRVLGFIGSFFFYEGLPDLVDSAARLARTRDDFALLLVGAGEDHDNVARRIAEHGLEGRVILTGRVPHEEVQEHYALMDVLVYPRHSRRLTEKVTPLKPLEAWAMERAVVGSDVGGIRELIAECGVGTTFRAQDADDMDRVLLDVLDRDPETLAAEGRRGREAVREKRCWDNTLQPTLDVYEKLAGHRVVAAVGN